MERGRKLDELAAGTFDLLVIGAGITGAGIARDAAMRGYRVALVEQDDFASGTSSRSSRLVHGGVRYLEHGQLHLVFESSRERRILLRIAPHLVRPLSFTWPLYKDSRIARWKLGAGLALYDALSLFRNVGRHARLSARAVADAEPTLVTNELLGGARYWDAATSDVRLTLANVLSAEDAGAVVANHVQVRALLTENERVSGAQVAETESGRTFGVRARVVVNAAGPWSDVIERMTGRTMSPAVRGSKGVHIAVPRARVGNVHALTLLAPQDGRVMFVLPAGSFAIVGTTDTFENVEPSEIRANERDVQYLLGAVNHYFPAARLEREDVVSVWAGLRPLAQAKTSAGAPGAVSREHAIDESAPGLVRVTGGKLTTYRAMAAEVVDVAERAMGETRRACTTSKAALMGGDVDVERAVAAALSATGDAATARWLVESYGSRWKRVWGLATHDAALTTRIVPELPYRRAALLYGVRHEHARSFGDLFIRRVPVAFETRDAGMSAVRSCAPSVSHWLGWSDETLASAISAYQAEVTRMFSVEPTV